MVVRICFIGVFTLIDWVAFGLNSSWSFAVGAGITAATAVIGLLLIIETTVRLVQSRKIIGKVKSTTMCTYSDNCFLCVMNTYVLLCECVNTSMQCQ